jgi:hypothetical protein
VQESLLHVGLQNECGGQHPSPLKTAIESVQSIRAGAHLPEGGFELHKNPSMPRLRAIKAVSGGVREFQPTAKYLKLLLLAVRKKAPA